MYLPKHPIDRFTDGVMESLDRAPSAVQATKPTPTPGAMRAAAEVMIGPNRCPICTWPLATSREHGCVIGDCSARGESLEQVRDRAHNSIRLQEIAAIIDRETAAPELLAALQELVDNINWQKVPASEEEFDAMTARAEAAIRKARGEQC